MTLLTKSNVRANHANMTTLDHPRSSTSNSGQSHKAQSMAAALVKPGRREVYGELLGGHHFNLIIEIVAVPSDSSHLSLMT